MLRKILNLNKKYFIYHTSVAMFFQMSLMMSISDMELVEILQAVAFVLTVNMIPYIIKKSQLSLRLIEWILLIFLVLIEVITLFCIFLAILFVLTQIPERLMQ